MKQMALHYNKTGGNPYPLGILKLFLTTELMKHKISKMTKSG